jgi:hypothetical protein
VIMVEGDTEIRVGTASLTGFGYGGSMDLDTWGEAELFCSGSEVVVVVASVSWDQAEFVCNWERWVSHDRGGSWPRDDEAHDLEDTPSLSFVTTSPSGERNRMVAWDRIERIWATLREEAPFLPQTPIRGWASLLSGGVGMHPPGGKVALERAKRRIDKLPEEKRALVLRKLRTVVELERVP